MSARHKVTHAKTHPNLEGVEKRRRRRSASSSSGSLFFVGESEIERRRRLIIQQAVTTRERVQRQNKQCSRKDADSGVFCSPSQRYFRGRSARGKKRRCSQTSKAKNTRLNEWLWRTTCKSSSWPSDMGQEKRGPKQPLTFVPIGQGSKYVVGFALKQSFRCGSIFLFVAPPSAPLIIGLFQVFFIRHRLASHVMSGKKGGIQGQCLDWYTQREKMTSLHSSEREGGGA